VKMSDTASKNGLPVGVIKDLMTAIAEGLTAGLKSKFTIFIHAHYKLTTSQEAGSRPKMWRCPTPPI